MCQLQFFRALADVVFNPSSRQDFKTKNYLIHPLTFPIKASVFSSSLTDVFPLTTLPEEEREKHTDRQRQREKQVIKSRYVDDLETHRLIQSESIVICLDFAIKPKEKLQAKSALENHDGHFEFAWMKTIGREGS